MTERFKTLSEPSGFEPPSIKGSRFIARLSPASDESAARAFIQGVALEFDDARHVCYAWRIGPDGRQTRAYDAGEPGNSAGRPILAQLEGHEVTDVVAVVVRYFGGTKLGVGGLMRAYGGAAGQALDRAKIVEVEVREALECRHDYRASGAVQAALAAFQLTPEGAAYDASVRFIVHVPRGSRAAFESAFRDATHGEGTLCDPRAEPPVTSE
ncbi:MAG: YigZ family protein [Planctomycetota bacterium]